MAAATSTANLFGPTQSALPQTNDGGLSFGTKLGIGLGVSAGGLTILISTALCIWRRHRWQRNFAIQASYDEEDPEDIPEVAEHPRMAELQGKELPRIHGRSELSERYAPVELESPTLERGEGKECAHDNASYASYVEGDDAVHIGFTRRPGLAIPPFAHVT